MKLLRYSLIISIIWVAVAPIGIEAVEELSSSDARTLTISGVIAPLNQLVKNSELDGEKVVRAYRHLEISAFSLEDVIFLEKEDSGLYIYWRHGISKNVNFNLADVKTFRRRFDSELAETFLSRLKQLSFEQREQAETDAFDDGVLIIVAKWEKGDVIFISEQALGRSNISDTRLRGFFRIATEFWDLVRKGVDR